MTIVGYGSRVVLWDKGYNVGGAIHKIEASKKTDMTFHTKLVKVLYVLSGDIVVKAIRDGRIKGFNCQAGSSLTVQPGFVYQLEANKDSIVVEFTNNPSGAYSDNDEFSDVHIITKGTPVPTDEPEGKLIDGNEIEEKTTEGKKTTTKKKTTRKKRASKGKK